VDGEVHDGAVLLLDAHLPGTTSPIRGVCPSRTVRLPSLVRSITAVAGPASRARSGVTTSTPKASAISCLPSRGPVPSRGPTRRRRRSRTPARARCRAHRCQRLEGLDGLVDRHGHALQTGEDLADVERLGQEPLDLAGTRDRDAVLFAELVEPEDRNDSCSSRKRWRMPCTWRPPGSGGPPPPRGRGCSTSTRAGRRRVDAEGGDLADSSVVASSG